MKDSMRKDDGERGGTESTTLRGESATPTEAGLSGANTGGGVGVRGYSFELDRGTGVAGVGATCGVEGWSNEVGVYGIAMIGVQGQGPVGVRGYGETGVEGFASHDFGIGVQGITNEIDGGWAIVGTTLGGEDCLAGMFSGDVEIEGALASTGAGYAIDHPEDPSGVTLSHAFVGSPERKNVYDGVGKADADGEIVVVLPAYVERVNRDFRYQLTAMGKAAPRLHVKEGVRSGRFVIAGAAPSQEVSWQVTGVRTDAWANAHPVVVEREKKERGLFRHPVEHGRPHEDGSVFHRLAKRADTDPVPRLRDAIGGAPKDAWRSY